MSIFTKSIIELVDLYKDDGKEDVSLHIKSKMEDIYTFKLVHGLISELL